MRDMTLWPIAERQNKVTVAEFARPIPDSLIGGAPLQDLFAPILAGQDLRNFIGAIKAAAATGRPLIWMMGAHLLKVGLGPILIQLIEGGYVQHLACNGAGAIHDFEIALIGATSEDVASNLENGRFGNWQETSRINDIIAQGAKAGLGYGQAIGQYISREKLPYRQFSVFAAAEAAAIPITVHTAIGTEITHQHPNADGAAIGQTSLTDFHRMIDTVAKLEKGVVMNWGSAVIMPEVFLKALTVARNRGANVQHFTAANFDMIRHYRPTVNVVERPTAHGGHGYTFIGQHEIILPLVALLILQKG